MMFDISSGQIKLTKSGPLLKKPEKVFTLMLDVLQVT